ncbi:MAG: hypothetical protein U5L45_26420 [Saprospiraceae bacterium]|nr:hypothetical protein [Saprospiraceae bacterium]
MKKTNLILVALLAILGSASAWYYAVKSNGSDTSLEGYDFNFGVKDTANIGKILIADRQGKTATLTRIAQNEWQINGKFKAMPNPVDNLLDVIARIELMYRLPRNAVAGVVQDMATISRLVQIYDKKGKMMRSYYIGGVDMDGRGTYLMMEGANEPYATHIPNFEGSPAIRYFTEEMDWRDRMVFTKSVEDIEEVSIDYPLQKGQSFRVKRAGSEFAVEPLHAVTPRSPSPVNQGLVEAFLIQFKKLGAEGFENTFEKKDSVQAVTPFAVVALTDKKGHTKTLRFHPIIKKDLEGKLVRNSNGEALIERYFAESSEGDFLLVQHLVFEKIFWAYSAFFGKH